MDFTKAEIELMLHNARTEYRNIGRIRDDLRRQDILNNSVNDDLYDRETAISALIKKLDKIYITMI